MYKNILKGRDWKGERFMSQWQRDDEGCAKINLYDTKKWKHLCKSEPDKGNSDVCTQHKRIKENPNHHYARRQATDRPFDRTLRYRRP